MQQYFAKDEKLTLLKTDCHHIKNVMRMKVNDIIKVVYNDTIYLCKITSLKDKVDFKVIDKENKKQDSVKIMCAFSLIKEQKQDYLIQKSTELGAYSFYPIKTNRSIIKIDEQKKDKKIDRWTKIAKEASEQSFRSYVPKINDIKTIKELKDINCDLKLYCSLNKNTKNLKKVLQKNNKCDTILIVIGPEGGFDPLEDEYLSKNGFIAVSLGSNVLRSETAMVSAISMINYEFER